MHKLSDVWGFSLMVQHSLVERSHYSPTILLLYQIYIVSWLFSFLQAYLNKFWVLKVVSVFHCVEIIFKCSCSWILELASWLFHYDIVLFIIFIKIFIKLQIALLHNDTVISILIELLCFYVVILLSKVNAFIFVTVRSWLLS